MTEARKMKATMGVTVVLRAQGARDTALADVTSRLAGRSKMRIHVEQPRNVYAPEVFSKRSISGTGLTSATSMSGAMTEACTIPRFDEPRAEWVLTMFMSERARVRMA